VVYVIMAPSGSRGNIIQPGLGLKKVFLARLGVLKLGHEEVPGVV